MSRKKKALAGTKILGTGVFKLDRARAMDKLARFQLEDPHRYVLELVSAGVRAGATAIHVRNDADDFEIEWDGRHPTEGELDTLFDHVFGEPTAHHPRMLQHLAQGILGGLGLQPKSIFLERPGITLDLTDPLDVSSRSNHRTQGVKVRVRERFSWGVAAEFANVFGEAHETELLQAAAQTCPIPLSVNGVEIQQPLAQVFDRPEHGLYREHDAGCTWLLDPDTAKDPRIAIIRDGIIVDYERRDIGPLRLGGWMIWDDGRLNASRSKIINDDAFKDRWRDAVTPAYRVIADNLHHPRSPIDGEKLIAAAHHTLTLDNPFAACLLDAPVFQDAAGQLHSIADLKQHKRVVYLRQTLPADTHWRVPQFRVPEDANFENCPRLKALSVHLGKRLQDGTNAIQERLSGMVRRRDLAARRHPVRLFAVAEADIDTPGFSGWIGLGVEGTPETHPGRITVQIRVDDLPIEAVEIPFPSTLVAMIGGDAFVANTSFTAVLRDQSYRDAIQAVRSAARTLISRAIAEQPHAMAVRAAVLGRIWATIRGNKNKDFGGVLNKIPDIFRDFAVFSNMTGEVQSVAELFSDKSASKARIQVVSCAFPVEMAQDGVIVISADSLTRLREWPGLTVIDITEGLTMETRAREKRASAKRTPVLAQATQHKQAFTRPGLHGEVGLLQQGMLGICMVEVLHQGVSLGVLRVPSVVGPSTAIIAWPAAEPNRDWSGLTDTANAIRTLRDELNEPLNNLVYSVVHEAALEPDYWVNVPLPAWLSDTFNYIWSRNSLGDVPLFRALSGQTKSLNDLDQQSPDKVDDGPRYWVPSAWTGGAVVSYGVDDGARYWVPSASYADRAQIQQLKRYPRFADVLLVDEARREILTAGVPNAADIGDEIAQFWRALSSFESKPFCPSFNKDRFGRPPASVGDEHLRARAVLDPEGTVTVLYQQRVLFEYPNNHPLSTKVHIDGKAIVPNQGFDGVDPDVSMSQLHERAHQAIGVLAEQIATDEAVPLEQGLHLLATLLTLEPFPEVSTSSTDAWRAALLNRPLFYDMYDTLVSAATVQEAHAGGRLSLVQDDATAWKLVPPASPAKHDRLWLRTPSAIQALLQQLLGEHELPDETPRFRTFIDGNFRRASAEAKQRTQNKSGLQLTYAANPDPRSLVHRSGTTEVHCLFQNWSRSGDDTQQKAQLTWHTDGLRVCSQPYPGPSPLIIHVDDPHISANIGFDDIVEDAHRARVASVVAEAVNKLMVQIWHSKKTGPSIPEPPTARILLHIPIPGENRSGHLSVLRTGAEDVRIHTEAWRPLGRMVLPGPVPMVGNINDPDLRPDPRCEAPESDAAFSALQADLAAAGESALTELLARPDLTDHPALVHALLVRNFSFCKQIENATGTLGRLADCKVFTTADGQPRSARDLEKRNGKLLWTTDQSELVDPDSSFPIIRSGVPVDDNLQALLGRDFAQPTFISQAGALHVKLRDQAQEFALPSELGPWAARVDSKVDGPRTRVGLSIRRLELSKPGMLILRDTNGVPLETRAFGDLGMVTLMAMPRSRISDDWKSARPADERLTWARTQYPRLVAQALQAFQGRDGAIDAFLMAFAQLRSRHPTTTALFLDPNSDWSNRQPWLTAWLNAPSLSTPGGAASLHDAIRSVARHKVVIYGAHAPDTPGPLVLLPNPANQHIINATPLSENALSMEEWHQRKQQDLAEKTAAQIARARQETEYLWHKHIERCVRSLCRGLTHSRAIQKRLAMPPCPLDTNQVADATTQWIHAWAAMESALVAAGEDAAAAEITVRLGERLR